MAEKEQVPRNEIIKSGAANDRVLPAAARDKIVRGLATINEEAVLQVLTSIFSHAEITADAVKYIQRGIVYLAEIPKNLQRDFAEGNLKFLEKKTGEIVGNIVGPNNFGTKGYAVIKDAGILHSDIPHDLTMIAMQQKLAQMAETIDEVRSRVVELQKTYGESLLGELRGMRDQLAQVQRIDDLENQRDLIRGAITNINLSRGKITQRLIAEIRKIPEIPQSNLLRFFATFFHEGIREKAITGYEKVQELFSYYLAASELLAFAYALLGEQRTYRDIFTPDSELLDDKRLANLKNCEACLGICDERWYSAPERYLECIKRKAQEVFLQSPDTVRIEVTGDQVLEAIENVRSTEETEGGED